MEVATLLGDKRVYFNYYWEGVPVSQTEIREWTSCMIEPPVARTVEETLEVLDSEVWSRPHESPGFAVLCLPMPLSTSQWESPVHILPARPVYTDFTSYEYAAETAKLKDLPLDRLSFVVFDTETTGLAPLDGDEIISLAGVKIVNLGIIIGETFNRLVDPKRSIPQSSIRFHGLTDEMVRGKPSIEETLRAFHLFVGDSVLVGHNAAFDMRFIRRKEDRAGVRFRGPVLDTLTLSLCLHYHTPEHSLDAVARRLGVEIKDRHTALGDALITAQVFIKFIHVFKDKGITTLGDILEALRR
jgi:DNA polymerase-3 subunit epsilon